VVRSENHLISLVGWVVKSVDILFTFTIQEPVVVQVEQRGRYLRRMTKRAYHNDNYAQDLN
jgi:uncharacterized protein YjiK